MAEAIMLEWVLPPMATAVTAAVVGPPGRSVWGTFTGVLADQGDLQAALDGKLAASAVNVTVQGYSVQLANLAGLSPADDDILQRKAGAWTSRSPGQIKTDLTLAKGDVGLGNVEDTALSGWGGSANLTTLGMVTGGTWAADAVAPAHGGTGLTSYAAGDLVYATGPVTLARLAGAASGSVLVSGGVGGPPAWGKVGLASHVSGVLPVASGGTGQATTGAAINALLPAQTAASGKFLTSDGNNPSWGSPSTAWGGITGALSAQSDLQGALAGKLGLAVGHVGYVSGRWYTSSLSALPSTVAAGTDQLIMIPLYIGAPVALTDIAISVSSAVGGSNYKAGVYSNNAGYPDTKLAEATLSTAATGQVSGTLSSGVVLTPGWYWLAGLASANPVLASGNAIDMSAGFLLGNTLGSIFSGAQTHGLAKSAFGYANGLPNTVPAGMGLQNGALPIIAVKAQ